MNAIFYFYVFSLNVWWRKPTVKISVNQQAMNGISESLQWLFKGIQGVKHYIVIYSSSFCASLLNILRRLERVFLVAIVFVKRWKIAKKDIS